MNVPRDNFLLAGVIVSSFGIQGQVKLRAITDHPENLGQHIKTIYVGEKLQPYQITRAFEHKPGLLVLTLKGVTTRDMADALRGTEVSILETDALPLVEGEYYLHQLYGLRVETTEGEELGHVREVIETGANEVLVIARPDQSDALVPMVHDIVQQLDIPGGRIVIRVLEGLL